MNHVHVESNSQLPLVRATVAFEGGNAQDPPGKEGLALVTARMLRRGAAGLSAAEIESRIDGLGGSFSSHDVRMSSSLIRLSVLRRSLDPMVELVASMLARPTFDPVQLAQLLREVESEVVQAQDDDDWTVANAMDRVLFPDHPYGKTLGVASLRAITRADVLGFYGRHYGCASAAAISGDVSLSIAEGVALQLGGSALDGRTPARLALADPPRKTGRHLVFVDKPERTQCTILLGTLGTHPADPDHHALYVANAAFGGSFNSRLMEEVRVKRGWSYGASSGLGLERVRAGWTFSAQPKGEDAGPCVALLLEMIHRLREDGLTEDEVARMRQYIVRSQAFSVATADQRARRRLGVHLYGLPADYYDGFSARIAAVTRDEANAAVRARLSEENLVVAVLGTYAAHGAAIETAIAGLARREVVAFDAD